MHDHKKALELFHEGLVIPATPLALNEERRMDEESMRLLMRYYLAAGSGGIATAVHSTQFAIRDCGLFEPVISLVSQEIDRYEDRTGHTVMKICGACGDIQQAVKEAGIAKDNGYDAVLLSPGGLNDRSEEYLIKRTEEIASIIPVIGFYLQTAVGGRVFSYDYWSRIASIDGVIGIKCASFNRYTTFDVMRAVAYSPRRDNVTMYTGNDDNIVSDFLSEYSFTVEGKPYRKMFEGGLLGHFCVWTRKAVDLLAMIKEARKTGDYSHLLPLGPSITDMNAAVFDPKNGFAGCIPGINEVLRRQGLMKTNLCLDPEEALSPGQSEEITRVTESYPELVDDRFIMENIDKWRNQA